MARNRVTSARAAIKLSGRCTTSQMLPCGSGETDAGGASGDPVCRARARAASI